MVTVQGLICSWVCICQEKGEFETSLEVTESRRGNWEEVMTSWSLPHRIQGRQSEMRSFSSPTALFEEPSN